MSILEPDHPGQTVMRRSDERYYDADTIDGTLVDDPGARAPLVLGGRDFHSVTETICGWAENKTPKWWPLAFMTSAGIAGLGTMMILYLIITGVGVWGLQNPVSWGWAIVNFVWWV
ncbi:MAG: hypothetical protein KDA21_01620, partial [Phycisphaerales bacterium]|nr:hypothetical protein [Phycisphaerales bacterium]